MRRAVIDTNVFVSGVYYGGIPRAVLDCIVSGAVAPCFTAATFEELERVLGDVKFAREWGQLWFDASRYMDWLAGVSLMISRSVVPQIIADDPADNEILACAVSAKADVIVSGDNHLLALGSYANIPIITPEAFIREINA